MVVQEQAVKVEVEEEMEDGVRVMRERRTKERGGGGQCRMGVEVAEGRSQNAERRQLLAAFEVMSKYPRVVPRVPRVYFVI